jgi:TonB family protein
MLLPFTGLVLSTTPAELSVAVRLVAGVAAGAEPVAIDTVWPAALTALLVAGAVARVGWLAVGGLAIRRLVSRSRPLTETVLGESLPHGVPARAEVRLSDDVSGPVTFGLRRPVVLVPPTFFSLPREARRAVLFHELLHVARRDWLRMLIEEIWCAVVWFHPLARALVSQVDLAREMLVDRLTIATTGDRRAYVQALIAFAGTSARPAAISTPFMRPAHFSRRIAGLSAAEVPMSRVLSAIGLCTAVLITSVTTVSSAVLMPMSRPAGSGGVVDARGVSAHPQDVQKPGPGVTLPRVVREVKPDYTPEALQAKIQGSMALTTVVGVDGVPGRIVVTRSLDAEHGLDAAAVAALEQWRFEPGRKDGKAVPVEVEIEMRFTLK